MDQMKTGPIYNDIHVIRLEQNAEKSHLICPALSARAYLTADACKSQPQSEGMTTRKLGSLGICASVCFLCRNTLEN